MMKTDIDFELLAQKREGSIIVEIDEVLMHAGDTARNIGQITMPVLDGDRPWNAASLRDHIITERFGDDEEDSQPLSFRATALFYLDPDGNRSPLAYGSRVQVEDTYERDLADVLRALQEDEA
jgi:hypothetical protein